MAKRPTSREAEMQDNEEQNQEQELNNEQESSQEQEVTPEDETQSSDTMFLADKTYDIQAQKDSMEVRSANPEFSEGDVSESAYVRDYFSVGGADGEAYHLSDSDEDAEDTRLRANEAEESPTPTRSESISAAKTPYLYRDRP